jgi:hypothetical protein
MPVTRLLLIAVAASALTAFVDAEKKFSVEFPEGWSTRVVATDGTVQADPPAEQSSVYCRANSIALANLNNISQASLNVEFAKPIGRDTWAGVLSVDAAKIEIVESSVTMVNGHVVQYATFVLDASLLGSLTKLRYASHILSGRMVNAGCFAPVGGYDEMKAAFEKVVTSLKPL